MTKKRTSYYIACSVSLLTFLVYLRTLQNDFVELDDPVYVRDNPYIRSFSHDLFRWAFFKFYAANWHPLTWLSHAVDYALWGPNPWGHHLTNVILHSINTLLVILLVVRILSAVKDGIIQASSSGFLSDQAILITAGITGLLFGLHPVHVESVAWVAERKDLLCALFFLLSIKAYANYAIGRQAAGVVRDEGGGKNLVTSKQYLFALGFFVLALMSKPMAVTLPVVLLILDWYPFGKIRDIRTFRIVLIEKLPHFGFAVGSSVLTILAQETGGALASMQLIPWTARVLVAARSLINYLGMMIFPRDLAPFYPYPGVSEISIYRAEYFIPIILLIGVTAACVKVVKRHKIWLMAWSYYMITLLPVLGIMQVGAQSMADRYTYLPSLGPFLLAGITGAWIYTRGYPGVRNLQFVHRMCIATAVVVSLLLSTLTIKQIGIWKDSMVVFDAILSKESRRYPTVYVCRGMAYERAGMLESAIDDYSRAIALYPSYFQAYLSRGYAYGRVGRLDRALEDYSEAIFLRPSSFEAYTNRGITYKKLGRRSRAVMDFDQAVALSPLAGKAYFNLGIIHAEDGLPAQAIEQFSRAITADPMDAEAYGNRGIAYAVTGQQIEALKDFNRALELRPDVSAIYYNRGTLYAASGQRERALADFQKACRLGDESGCRALGGQASY